MTITRSPVRRVIGYGSTGEGLGHSIRERVTALALVSLGIWSSPRPYPSRARTGRRPGSGSPRRGTPR